MDHRPPAVPAGLYFVTGALSGLLSAGLGIAGGLLEGALTGPWPDAADPNYAQFLVANRVPVLAQSMLFVFSPAALLWFLGYVRGRLLSAEPAPGTVTLALRLVPLLWYVPAAVVMLRRPGVLRRGAD